MTKLALMRLWSQLLEPRGGSMPREQVLKTAQQAKTANDPISSIGSWDVPYKIVSKSRRRDIGVSSADRKFRPRGFCGLCNSVRKGR
jgi:hypothetical protein